MHSHDRHPTPVFPLPAQLGLVVVIAVALFIHAPGLHTGMLADDYLQRSMLDGTYPIPRASWDLYSFFRGADELPILTGAGTLPWWMPAELRLSLLRPLPSLLLWLDHRVLGLSLYGMHLHSLAWLLAFLLSFNLLARRLLPPTAALVATALVAFDVGLVSPVAWLCNRATLVSATFAALGLYLYHRYREDGARRDAWLAAFAFSLSLLGGEYAICALAYVAAYELVAADDALRVRLRSAAFVFVPACVYGLVHVLGRYGAGGGSIYVSPLDSPLEFLGSALTRVPSMLATELLLLPGEAVYVAFLLRSPLLPWALVPMAIALVVLTLALRRLPAPLPRRMGAYALGVLLGLVPLSGTVPGVRLLLLPSIGGSLVLSAAICGALLRLREPALRRRPGAWLLALSVVPLAVLHVFISPRIARAQSSAFSTEAARLRQASYDSEIDDALVAQQDLVLLNLPGDLVALDYPVRVRQENGSPRPRSWRTLSSALCPLRVARIADDTLELRVENAGDAFFGYDAARRESPAHPFQPGQRVSAAGFEVEVVEVRGWAPTKLRYRFPDSLARPSRVFLRFEHGKLVRFPLPPVGAEASLPVGFP
ncbi:MAG: hypothetical protein IPI67_39895 [Myxococcales bacterium]|nr:hypothetical protein [Myxococcales bacterium]